jgi:hypothetical protein
MQIVVNKTTSKKIHARYLLQDICFGFEDPL